MRGASGGAGPARQVLRAARARDAGLCDDLCARILRETVSVSLNYVGRDPGYAAQLDGAVRPGGAGAGAGRVVAMAIPNVMRRVELDLCGSRTCRLTLKFESIESSFHRPPPPPQCS